MKKTKKAVSILLSAAMLTTAIPMTSFAKEISMQKLNALNVINNVYDAE